MSVTLSSCGRGASIADSFIEYDSTEFVTENDLSDRIPVFLVKYPPEWEYTWVMDSGVIALLVASGDANAAFNGRDYSGAAIMIIPVTYSGEKLTDLFYSILNGWHSTLEPSISTTINGQDAAWAEYTDEGNLYIEAVIANDEWALLTVANFPPEKETEFRSIIEAVINTISIK